MLGTFELLVAIVVGLTVLIGATVKTVQLFRRTARFLDDWTGEPAHGGRPALPGVMDRLALVEERTAQLVHNGGGSLKDAVSRIEQRLDELDEQHRRRWFR